MKGLEVCILIVAIVLFYCLVRINFLEDEMNVLKKAGYTNISNIDDKSTSCYPSEFTKRFKAVNHDGKSVEGYICSSVFGVRQIVIE